jgi:hypothetical protein
VTISCLCRWELAKNQVPGYGERFLVMEEVVSDRRFELDGLVGLTSRCALQGSFVVSFVGEHLDM